MSRSWSICHSCFFAFRTDPTVQCNHSGINKVIVQWNGEGSRLETTDWIRPIPERLPINVQYIAMCDPKKGTCRRYECTFAHGRAEQREWNKRLKDKYHSKLSSISVWGKYAVIYDILLGIDQRAGMMVSCI